ncbi:MAG: ubiquitin conjugation factor E4 [Lasallia pustulata]|uniref:Ubiquitin conjugation factor E4 n=1 Tax=Lasallia pustulata TaxID=136370 RepID=A0A5M8PLZ4_9LECA|nr:MAG: ubiquitin conjugation factor E4 [Lasallia pustulata]
MADSVPDALSDADKIRNKRLAKLGAQATPSSNSSAGGSGSGVGAPQATTSSSVNSATGSEHQQEPNPKVHNSPSSTQEAPKPVQNPFSQLGLRLSNGLAPRINISTAGGGTVTPQKRERVESESGRPSSRAGETLPEWEDRTLRGVFRITLDPDVRVDIHGHPLYYVASTREDLDQEGYPVRLGTHILDQAILEAASNLGKTAPLDYLLACWKRVARLSKTFKARNEDDPDRKYSIIKEAKRLCMSYCIFAVTMPDMFGREPSATNPLTPHLLVEQEDDRGLCHDFFTEAISRFSDDDTAKEALVGAIENLSRQLAKMSMNDSYKPYVLAFRTVVRYPALVTALVQSPFFLPSNIPPGTLEVATLLGPFFQISPLQGEVTTQYFSSPKTRDKSYIVNSQRALRMTLQTHQTDLLDIVNYIVKTGKESREKMLDWFALCVNSNHKRRAMQVDQKLVSSDGFMINVTVCLDQLCEPFMDATFSKIDRIDVDYLRRKPRVDITEETKLNADQNASDRFYDVKTEGTSNFISEVFFLTLAAHHYGSEAASSKLDQLEKDLKRMEKSVEDIELERHKFLSNPRQLRMFEEAVKKYKDQIDKGLSYKYAVQGVLLDDLTQARSMQFLRYVIVWLLRLVAPGHDFPKQPLHLPLPDQQPEVFKCLPEYFMEDVVGNFKFIMRNMPQIITSTQSDELIMLCITFLRSSEYIKNPYLKSGLVTILFHGIWETPHRAKEVLGDLLNSLQFATDHLLHALMKFYIEVENTGAHTQFYDKFNIRYEIFQVIKCIWSNPIYREHLSEEAKVNLDFFVRFVNLLLNDVTFVLDESLSAFVEIHKLQQELTAASSTMEVTARTDKEEALAAAKGKAKSYMQLTNETVAMLKLFTEALADSFTMPEIVQRLADMLDYNLDVMVGPKNTNLNVENRQEYGFNPKALLAEIVDVYLNLRDKENFVFAVARDGRSYKPSNFEKATALMRKHSLKSSQDVAAWMALGERFKRAKEMDERAEEDLGEVPEEFLDPLMFTLMEDPVILPTSRTSVDRSTIRSHLLSDPNDPFNRAPLRIEDVVPDTALRARIQAFKAEKKGRKIKDAGVMDVDVDVDMDAETG